MSIVLIQPVPLSSFRTHQSESFGLALLHGISQRFFPPSLILRTYWHRLFSDRFLCALQVHDVAAAVKNSVRTLGTYKTSSDYILPVIPFGFLFIQEHTASL